MNYETKNNPGPLVYSPLLCLPTTERDKNTPLVFYGSMWPDKEHGFYRFAHRSYLTGRENDDETGELLSSSPHYFIIACRVE
ncbi:DUF5041 domain-containing protein [Petrimonas sp.]|uniref:DUF5041 domain-containing protein n=1 Tax=Petrimonas sp. TaxID=2023866 RepID=UPI003F50FE3C